MALPQPSGAALIALEKSVALRDFEGVIAQAARQPTDPPQVAEVERRDWLPSRVVAIDGASVSHKVRNGFPGAEASLLLLSVVVIDVSAIAAIKPGEIPSPRVFNEMDSPHTLDAVLPGANVVRGGLDGDTPVEFFRECAHTALSGKLDPEHETLLETLRAITQGRASSIRCPISGCDRDFTQGSGEYSCVCELGKPLFETDALRFHERFNEVGSNGEVHGEVRRVIEVLSLINIIRYFENEDRMHFLRDCAFVLDGPLAVFGQPAWISPYIKKELARISAKVRARFGQDLLVMGVEKTGQYVAHFREIDWCPDRGDKGLLPPSTAIIPDAKYINRNIVRRPVEAKPSGEDTYFGRKVLYKNKSGSHAVLNMGMINKESADFNNINADAFPRLGDALNILDHLSTYLYEDGFMPLIKAHAHAAIPLYRGAEILKALFNVG